MEPGSDAWLNLIDLNNDLLFPTEVDNIMFNSSQELDSFDDLFSNVETNLVNQEDVSSTNGEIVEDLFRLELGDLSEIMALMGDGPSNENPTEEQNPVQINFPTLQQAVGGDEGILYMVWPGLFGGFPGNISVKQQPKANTRLRYLSDGSRFLPDSRYHPLSTELPAFLKLVSLQQGQSLGVVLTLATITDPAHPEMHVHANDLVCRVDGAVKIGYGCVFVPFDSKEITAGEKKFSRLSIIYKKCDEYSFQLIPFNTTTMFGPAGEYVSSNPKNTGVAARGKDFKRDHQLLSYKLVFQLAVKHGDIVYISELACESDDIHEATAPPPATTAAKVPKGKKRASPSLSSDFPSEDESVSNFEEPTSSKRLKTTDSLPVTRVSGQDASPSTSNHVHC